MPAKGEPSGSCGGAQGNESACPGPGAVFAKSDSLQEMRCAIPLISAFMVVCRAAAQHCELNRKRELC